MSRTQTSRIIQASREALYDAFVNPDALVQLMPPGNMTGKMHRFDARVGGGYEMSLFYPEGDTEHQGKKADLEDRVKVRFDELSRPDRIVEAVLFDSEDPAFAGEMTFIATFESAEGGTKVTITCEHIPSGIRPEDNDEGSRQSLENFARFFERSQD